MELFTIAFWSKFIDVCSQGYNWQHAIIASGSSNLFSEPMPVHWQQILYGLDDDAITYFGQLRTFNTLSRRQNRRHFAGGIFKCIFVIEYISISLKISFKFELTLFQDWFR